MFAAECLMDLISLRCFGCSRGYGRCSANAPQREDKREEKKSNSNQTKLKKESGMNLWNESKEGNEINLLMEWTSAAQWKRWMKRRTNEWKRGGKPKEKSINSSLWWLSWWLFPAEKRWAGGRILPFGRHYSRSEGMLPFHQHF